MDIKANENSRIIIGSDAVIADSAQIRAIDGAVIEIDGKSRIADFTKIWVYGKSYVQICRSAVGDGSINIFDSYLAISGENRFERMLEIGLERGNIDWESKHIWNKLSD